MKSLGIAIDGGRFVRIDNKPSDLSKNVRLRTLSGRQSAARLDFYSFRGARRVLRKTVRLEGLKAFDGAPAELVLRVERLSGAVWDVRVRRPDGRSERIRVRAGIGGAAWLLAAALIVLLAAAMFLLFSGRDGRGVPSSGWGSGASSPGIGADAGSEAPGGAGGTDGTGTGRSDAMDSSRDAASVPAAPSSNDAAADAIGGGAQGEGSDAGTGAAAAESAGNAGGDAVDEKAGKADGLDGGAAAAAADGTDSAAAAVLPDPITVYFGPESSELTPRAKAALAAFAEQIPEDAVVEIGGHCADYGTERGRTMLSSARAQAAGEYIGGLAGPSVRIRTAGYGVSRPATRDPGRQDLNRRAELSVRREP